MATMVLSIVLAACESAPVVLEQPGEPTLAAPMQMLVAPLTGLSPRLGYALGEKMAWGLREAGYPARFAPIPDGASPVLRGEIEEIIAPGDVVWLDINWSAYGASGLVLGFYHQKAAVLRSGWDNASQDSLAAIVTDAVPSIHQIIKTEVFPAGIVYAQSEPIGLDATFVPTMEPSGPAIETVVVSGEGLSHIDVTGKETGEHDVSVSVEPVFAPDSPNLQGGGAEPDVITEILPQPVADSPNADALPLLDKVVVQSAPAQDALRADETAQSAAASVLTPQSAALVSTSPDVTMSSVYEPLAEKFPEPLALDQPYESSPVQPDVATDEAAAMVEPAIVVPVALKPVFLVAAVTGAPGDGNSALYDAMRERLRIADVMMSNDLERATHIIQGSVRLDAPLAGLQQVRVVWLVSKRDGREVGSAVQENKVVQGALDSSWGAVAPIIVDAAIAGISKLFDAPLGNGSDALGAGGGLSQPDLPHLQGIELQGP